MLRKIRIGTIMDGQGWFRLLELNAKAFGRALG